MSEYILLKDNKNLLGKRAKFKDKLVGYCRYLWNKEGVIIQHKGVEHIGLSLKFDTPTEWLDTCYIAPNSIFLIEESQEEK